MLVNSFVSVMNAAAPGGGNITLIFMVLLLGMLYFLMIRPQKKREKEMREQIGAMQVGDKVLTIGGVVGKVVNLQDDEVTIATSVANTLLTFKKSAISTVYKEGQGSARKTESSASAESEKKPSFFDRFKRKDPE